MKFTLIPMLNKMEQLYQMPKTQERFEQYLLMLQGNQKGELILPIMGYNPMAKENVLLKLRALKKLKAEQIIENELKNINATLKTKDKRTIEVVLNIADDVGGAWSNFYTTDFASKFDINALVNRNFCAPYFWTSEDYTEALIAQRTREYAYRTLYWLENGKPKTLEAHFNQEVFVQKNTTTKDSTDHTRLPAELETFYLKHLESVDYSLIFNFFYGDAASESLAFATYGIPNHAGFFN